MTRGTGQAGASGARPAGGRSAWSRLVPPGLAAGPRPGPARAGWAALAAVAVAQVASVRAGHLVLATSFIVALLAAASIAFTAVAAGWWRAAAAAGAAFGLGLAAEWTGTSAGVPFGAYHYTGVLRPAIATVPVAVPLAWAAMGLPGYATGYAIARHRAGRIVAGAVALTAWDAFLDPQMLRNGFWRWSHPGPYHGVPLSNFAGWLLVSALLMVVFDVLLARPGGGPGQAGPYPGLLAAYTLMAVMETVGFAVIFPHGATIALAGGLAMGIPAALAWARRGGTG